MDSFLLGTATAFIVESSQSGFLGDTLVNSTSESLAAAVLITYNSIKATIAYTKGNISKAEMAHEIASKTVSIIGASVGSFALSIIPGIGTMLGSMIGSIIANTVYNQVNNMFLSIFIENGSTFFGLVDQDYQLTNEILEELGYDLMEYDYIEYDKLKYESIEYDSVEYDTIDYEKIEIKFIRRGIIGVNKIGYL